MTNLKKSLKKTPIRPKPPLPKLFLLLILLGSSSLQAQSALESIQEITRAEKMMFWKKTKTTLSENAYDAEVKDRMTQGRRGYVACETCPIIWFDTDEQLAELQRQTIEKNKGFPSGGQLADVETWKWARKLNILINVHNLIGDNYASEKYNSKVYYSIKRTWVVHKAMYPKDASCPEKFPSIIKFQ